jgi:hypothetical protein
VFHFELLQDFQRNVMTVLKGLSDCDYRLFLDFTKNVEVLVPNQ